MIVGRVPGLVGIDIGTTNIKVVVISLTGDVEAISSKTTPWVMTTTGKEISPDRLFDAVRTAIGTSLSKAGRFAAGIGVASMGQSGTVVDGRGDALLPFVSWDDLRTTEAARWLEIDVGSSVFRRITGLGIGPSWSLCRLKEIQETDTIDSRADHTWLGVAEWVAFRLTGVRRAEPSLASQSGLFDFRRGQWSSELVHWAQWSIDGLPEISEAGVSIGRAVATSKEIDGAPVTIAGHDHLVAAQGARAADIGIAFDSCGTAETIVRITNQLSEAELDHAAKLRLQVGRNIVAGQLAVTSSFATTSALKRVLQVLGVGEGHDFGRIDVADLKEVTSLDPFSSYGDQRKEMDPLRIWLGALIGSAKNTERALRDLDTVCGFRESVVLAGGWSNDAAFVAARKQEIKDLLVSQVKEPGALGAARLAGFAIGLDPREIDLPRV